MNLDKVSKQAKSITTIYHRYKYLKINKIKFYYKLMLSKVINKW